MKGGKLVWVSGDAKDAKYNDFLAASKTTTFTAGQGLIGKVYAEGGSKTVDVTTLGSGYLRLDAAKKAGLSNCTVTKDGEKVHEKFWWYIFDESIF